MTEDSPLAPVRDPGEAVPRKAHYGQGIQPYDIIVAEGWGPAFAAANVVKYIRRTKSPEHSLESARWYYARLYEGASGPIESRGDWESALSRLELLLTKDEVVRLRTGAEP